MIKKSDKHYESLEINGMEFVHHKYYDFEEQRFPSGDFLALEWESDVGEQSIHFSVSDCKEIIQLMQQWINTQEVTK